MNAYIKSVFSARNRFVCVHAHMYLNTCLRTSIIDNVYISTCVHIRIRVDTMYARWLKSAGAVTEID